MSGASKFCKDAGLNSLKELSELTGQSVQTLANWYNDKPELFRLVVRGALAERVCRVPEIKRED